MNVYKFDGGKIELVDPIIVSFDLIDNDSNNEDKRDIWGKLQTPDGTKSTVFLGVLTYSLTMNMQDIMDWCVVQLEEFKQ